MYQQDEEIFEGLESSYVPLKANDIAKIATLSANNITLRNK
ncbi:hypothetical protein HMPREF9953_0850 [Haemophilus parainfluenzae ATCC 33392]|uniref:Uncharacterized protein n=1 Tax=Haemophilus parainfluenzae ATCC 33392 TaxID=888828 RepID=A0ABD7ZIL6_HAEPA|nr:hypothetical protein [Haemophilus parainfluenzae]KFL99652.1 hypothetical protein HMPREF9953_0850 [Haemophilus parainfluenzae ATCC 33392]WMS24814.1 hypothetical protein RDV53_03510 [Haemophilus parainfluenzae ATCC 33392]